MSAPFPAVTSWLTLPLLHHSCEHSGGCHEAHAGQGFESSPAAELLCYCALVGETQSLASMQGSPCRCTTAVSPAAPTTRATPARAVSHCLPLVRT